MAVFLTLNAKPLSMEETEYADEFAPAMSNQLEPSLERCHCNVTEVVAGIEFHTPLVVVIVDPTIGTVAKGKLMTGAETIVGLPIGSVNRVAETSVTSVDERILFPS